MTRTLGWWICVGLIIGSAVSTVATCRVIDDRVVEITGYPAVNDRCYLWLSMNGDPLVLDYMRTTYPKFDGHYLINRRDMPKPPEAILQSSATVPSLRDTTSWPITAAFEDGDNLWLALAYIPQPLLQSYISDPPHPWRKLAFPPYEGGALRVNLKTMTLTRWTSAQGLPQEMVCRYELPDIDTVLPLWLVQGSRVVAIEKQGDDIEWITRNESRLRYDPRADTWRVVQSGEAMQLIDGYPHFTPDVKTRALYRLGELRAKAAVPLLLNALEKYETASIASAASQALIAIGDTSVINRLEQLRTSENRAMATDAHRAWARLSIPFSDPVNGIAFRLLPYDLATTQGCTCAILECRNTTPTRISCIVNETVYYFPNVEPPCLEYLLTNADDPTKTIVQRETYDSSVPVKTENVQFITFPTLVPGRYTLAIHIKVSQEYAGLRKAKYQINAWHGEITTNTVQITIVPAKK